MYIHSEVCGADNQIKHTPMDVQLMNVRVNIVLNALTEAKLSLPQLLLTILTEAPYASSPFKSQLLSESEPFSSEVWVLILMHFKAAGGVAVAVTRVMEQKWRDEMEVLTDIEGGLQFGAINATAGQIEEFRLPHMADGMRLIAPTVWRLLDLFLVRSGSKGEGTYHDTIEDVEEIIECVQESEEIQREKRAKKQQAMISVVCCISKLRKVQKINKF